MASGAPRTTRVELAPDRAVLVAPLHVDDRERYLGGFAHVSADSLYRRFMTPVARLSSAQLRYLLDVDHRDHEALLAVGEDSGEAVAIARFVRDRERSEVAEAAVLVVDDWQGLGLGKALCRLLADRARELQIKRFEASLLAENRPMMTVLESLGPVRILGHDGSTVTVDVEL